MCVRLCQFHIIQALIRYAKEAITLKNINHKNALIDELLVIFRKAQRARSLADWNAAYHPQFNSSLKELFDKYNISSQLHRLQLYFDENWWGAWLGKHVVQ